MYSLPAVPCISAGDSLSYRGHMVEDRVDVDRHARRVADRHHVLELLRVPLRLFQLRCVLRDRLVAHPPRVVVLRPAHIGHGDEVLVGRRDLDRGIALLRGYVHLLGDAAPAPLEQVDERAVPGFRRRIGRGHDREQPVALVIVGLVSADIECILLPQPPQLIRLPAVGIETVIPWRQRVDERARQRRLVLVVCALVGVIAHLHVGPRLAVLPPAHGACDARALPRCVGHARLEDLHKHIQAPRAAVRAEPALVDQVGNASAGQINPTKSSVLAAGSGCAETRKTTVRQRGDGEGVGRIVEASRSAPRGPHPPRRLGPGGA